MIAHLIVRSAYITYLQGAPVDLCPSSPHRAGQAQAGGGTGVQGPGHQEALSADVAKAEEDKAARKKEREAGEDQPRLYNRDFVSALDWALLKANGWGLAEFLPRRAVGRLGLGDTVFFEAGLPHRWQPAKQSLHPVC